MLTARGCLIDDESVTHHQSCIYDSNNLRCFFQAYMLALFFFFVSLTNLSPFSLLFEKVTFAQSNKYQQSYPRCITVFLSISFYYTYYYYYYYYYYLNSYLIIFVIFFNVCIYESVYIDEWQPQNGNSVFSCYYRVIFYLCIRTAVKNH